MIKSLSLTDCIIDEAREVAWLTTRLHAHCERIYSLTEKGKGALDRARPYWQDAQTRLRQSLGEADWLNFLNIQELRTRKGQPIDTAEPSLVNRFAYERSAA
jgi:DNA-binding PadR family transcriptional regulator